MSIIGSLTYNSGWLLKACYTANIQRHRIVLHLVRMSSAFILFTHAPSRCTALGTSHAQRFGWDLHYNVILTQEMITRRVPWTGMDPLQIVMAVTKKNTRLLVPATCDPVIKKIIKSVWQQNPEKRYDLPFTRDFATHHLFSAQP